MTRGTPAGLGEASSIVVPTKAEAVYHELRDRILDGKLAPGSVVNQESLAARLGISITPLREALRRLEAERLVVLHAHRTLMVAPLRMRELRELYAVRLQLDPYAASLAATAAAPGTLDEIEHLAKRAPEDSAHGRLDANRAFHRAIHRGSGNEILATLLDGLWDLTDRYRLLAVQDAQHERTARREHREISHAIRNRNAGRAGSLMYEHVAATLTLLEYHADVG